MHSFPLPREIDLLINAGLWPRNDEEARRQNLHPLIPVERIHLFAPEESMLCLAAPPFCTARKLVENGEVWWESADAAPDEISLDHSMCIGDFGLGSDAPIILDYRESSSEPRVMRLNWERSAGNHWVVVANDFRTFAELLGLSD